MLCRNTSTSSTHFYLIFTDACATHQPREQQRRWRQWKNQRVRGLDSLKNVRLTCCFPPLLTTPDHMLPATVCSPKQAPTIHAFSLLRRVRPTRLARLKLQLISSNRVVLAAGGQLGLAEASWDAWGVSKRLSACSGWIRSSITRHGRQVIQPCGWIWARSCGLIKRKRSGEFP